MSTQLKSKSEPLQLRAVANGYVAEVTPNSFGGICRLDTNLHVFTDAQSLGRFVTKFFENGEPDGCHDHTAIITPQK
jgi:hypothetical protein